MMHLRHAFRTRPHFVAYWVNELPAAAPWIARHVFGLPLLTWTVRTAEQRERAARYADQMIFEGFRPWNADAAVPHALEVAAAMHDLWRCWSPCAMADRNA